jgi:hypothetical protein
MGALIMVSVVLSALVAVAVAAAISYRRRSDQLRRRHELDYEHNPPQRLDHDYIQWLEHRERAVRDGDDREA